MTSSEIVAPGGNLEKLKTAVYYGADAVYFGGEMMNLRDKSQNMTIPELEEAESFCRKNGVKSVFLLNAFVHEGDIDKLGRYIGSIRHIPFSAVMVSDPATLHLVGESMTNSLVYLSTQASTLNHIAARFWQKQGISRIVLARETTLDDIRAIREHTDVELEIFAHGAVCISYSG
ncbi:MAG: peptidase U32 family protein, partial [Spirochaetota bacterium]